MKTIWPLLDTSLARTSVFTEFFFLLPRKAELCKTCPKRKKKPQPTNETKNPKPTKQKRPKKLQTQLIIKTDVSTINNFCVGRNNHVQYLY